MNGWSEIVKQVMPHVVKIEFPDSHGSGFLIAYRKSGPELHAVIATAAHVVRHAERWGVACRILYEGKEINVRPGERWIAIMEAQDVAIVEFCPGDWMLPATVLPVLGKEVVLPPGYPLGWCGYPNIADRINCFFAGHVSTPLAGTGGDYLVDGVVIHGVSGSPAFARIDGKVMLVGLVSAYYPNRATGEALPGIGLVQSIRPIIDLFNEANGASTKKGNKKCSGNRSAGGKRAA